jgi:hypothetical protein
VVDDCHLGFERGVSLRGLGEDPVDFAGDDRPGGNLDALLRSARIVNSVVERNLATGSHARLVSRKTKSARVRRAILGAFEGRMIGQIYFGYLIGMRI